MLSEPSTTDFNTPFIEPITEEFNTFDQSNFMLSPGSKGWINKYFDLVEKEVISLELERPDETRKLQFMHLTFGHSGIVFGYPMQYIFAKEIDDAHWTTGERLKFLLFESHLFIYQQIHIDEPFDKNAFLESLTLFYKDYNSKPLMGLFTLFKKESNEEILESVLTKRIDIRLNLLDNKWWVNSLSNAIAYLDVILFDDFEHKLLDEALDNYALYAENALTAIILAAYSDGKIESKEADLFHLFLASAHLDDEDRDLALERFKKGASIEDLAPWIKQHWLLKRFLFDISALTILATHETQEDELQFLDELGEQLKIDETEREDSLRIIENFILKSKDEVAYLNDSSKYDKVYKSFSNRWAKVILRNKDKLKKELRESKELVALIKKSRSSELTKEEKDAVKTQFKDLAKSIPSLTVFMLPGGAILMPLLLRLIPDMIPSAFKENEIDDKDEGISADPESNPS